MTDKMTIVYDEQNEPIDVREKVLAACIKRCEQLISTTEVINGVTITYTEATAEDCAEALREINLDQVAPLPKIMGDLIRSAQRVAELEETLDRMASELASSVNSGLRLQERAEIAEAENVELRASVERGDLALHRAANLARMDTLPPLEYVHTGMEAAVYHILERALKAEAALAGRRETMTDRALMYTQAETAALLRSIALKEGLFSKDREFLNDLADRIEQGHECFMALSGLSDDKAEALRITGKRYDKFQHPALCLYWPQKRTEE